MKVRLADENDQKEVLRLLSELSEEIHRKSNQSKKNPDRQKQASLFREVIKQNDVKVFVIDDSKRLFAIVFLYIFPNLRRGYYQARLEDFVVTEGMRGKGLGTKLLKEVLRYGKEHGIKAIKLTSGFELEDAHRFYEKHGAKTTERMFRFDL